MAAPSRRTPPRPPAEPPAPHQRLDHLCKRAMAIDKGRILEALLDASDVAQRLELPRGKLTFLGQLPTEIQRGDLRADDLLLLRSGKLEWLAHIEYQHAPDPTMPFRVLDYQAALVARYRRRLATFVFQVYGKPQEGVVLETLNLGSLKSHYVVVNLARALLSFSVETPSPMVLILRALLGVTDVPAALARLESLGIGRETCRDLIQVVSFLLDKRQGKGSTPHADIAKELFAMLKLEDSWLYQEGIEKGIEKGIRTLQETAVVLAKERFGPDEVGAERIRRISDAGQLSALIVRLGTAPTLKDALSLLS